MTVRDSLKKRRSYYNIDDNIKVSQDEIVKALEEIVELVPDAYDMKSQSVILVMGEKHKELWDLIYDTFGGRVKREKIDSFKNGAGTVLFFTDQKKVDDLKEAYPNYAHNFDGWALQSNGMLQINVWTGLRELGLGASIQHYNPVIDENVKKMFDVDENWTLLAQMVFGNIVEEPEEKEKEDLSKRMKIFK